MLYTTDIYEISYNLVASQLIKANLYNVSWKAGGEPIEDGSGLILLYCSRLVKVDWHSIIVTALDEGSFLSITEQILILHYLKNADGTLPSGQWVTFREIESGGFYWSAFVKRAIKPFLNFFGFQPRLLFKVAPKIGGKIINSIGDVAVVVPLFPLVNFMLVLWEGDDEFSPEANVLMDSNISHFLSTEDIALSASLLVYKIIKIGNLLK